MTRTPKTVENDTRVFLTVVYSVPPKSSSGFAAECGSSAYFSAASWSHAMADRDEARFKLATVTADVAADINRLPRYSREMRGGQHGRIGFEDFYAAEDVCNLAVALAADAPAETVKPATFAPGTIVRKKSGSQWEGAIVGTYSSSITPEGYAVESSMHRGSVQIYPVSALELVTKGNV